MEIKARFDEEAQHRLGPRAGAAPAPTSSTASSGLKTHSKIALVVRREGGRLRRYVHIGTGNYNPGRRGSTPTWACSRLLAGASAADVTDLFNVPHRRRPADRLPRAARRAP